jgi:hypothetical protein
VAGSVRQVRLFVSSPGDARFERSRLERVTERLNGEFQGIARIVPIRWETEFYKVSSAAVWCGREPYPLSKINAS